MTPIDIIGVGMVTSLGIGARPCAAAIRAGTNQFRATSLMDKYFEPRVMSVLAEDYLDPLVDAVDPKGLTSAHERMLKLGAPALGEAAKSAGHALPLFLALPEARPGEPDQIRPEFLAQLALQADVELDQKQSRLFREGGAGAMLALQAAIDLIAEKKAKRVLVGGIDTFLDLRRLSQLEQEDRIRSQRAMDAFIPGEGAGFLLLTAAPSTDPIAQIVGVGTGVEKGHRYSKEAYRGDGLADALKASFAQLGASFPKIGCVYAGFNGENLSAKEWGVAYLRSADRFAEKLEIEHPADCIGDAGAALGPIMIACAALGMQKKYRASPCLVWSTSDREARGAAILKAI